MAEETNIVRITGATVSNLPEGTRLTYSYTVLDKDGNVIDKNKSDSFILLEQSAIEAANTLLSFAKEHFDKSAK